MPMVNVKPVKLGKNVRMSFSRIGEVLEMPNLIEVQKNSYRWFLEEGLKEVFHDVSPMTESRRMHSIIAQLLALTRGYEGKYQLSLEEITLAEMVSDVLAELTEEAAAGGITLIEQVPPHIQPVSYTHLRAPNVLMPNSTVFAIKLL